MCHRRSVGRQHYCVDVLAFDLWIRVLLKPLLRHLQHIADNATTTTTATPPTPPPPHQQANVVDNSRTTESTRARVVCIYNISDETSAYRTHTFLTPSQSVWRWRSCITDSGTPFPIYPETARASHTHKYTHARDTPVITLSYNYYIYYSVARIPI